MRCDADARGGRAGRPGRLPARSLRGVRFAYPAAAARRRGPRARGRPLPTAPRPRRGRRGAARRRPRDRAGRDRRPRRRDRRGQVDAGQAAGPLLRPRRRARSLVDGHDLRTLDLGAYRRQLGYVPQEAFLFTGTVRDNIAYGRPDATDAEVEAAARAVGAHDVVAGLPGGYRHEVAERGRSLSGGPAPAARPRPRRARRPGRSCCSTRPPPTSTSPPRRGSPRAMQRGGRGPHDGRHRPPAADRPRADRIAVLGQGRVVELGTHDELLAAGGATPRCGARSNVRARASGTTSRSLLARRLRGCCGHASGLRLLGPADLPAMLELTAHDPVVNVFADYRGRLTRLEPALAGRGDVGLRGDGRLVSACHSAANLVPVRADPEALDAFADRALAQPRRCATIVGPSDSVGRAVAVLGSRTGRRPARSGGTSRTWRSPAGPAVAPDPLVRRTTAGRRRRALPGVRGDVHRGGRRLPGAGRRRRALPGPGHPAGLAGLVVRPDRGRPGRVQGRGGGGLAYACQVQGVYVDPDRRGRGTGRRRDGRRRASIARRDIAPVVSLYVNEHNQAARAGLRARRASRRPARSPP